MFFVKVLEYIKRSIQYHDFGLTRIFIKALKDSIAKISFIIPFILYISIGNC